MLMRLLQRPGWMAADRLGLHNPTRIYFWGQYGRRGVAERSERAGEPCHIRHVGLWVCAAGYGRFVVAINMANGQLWIWKKFSVLKYWHDYRANISYSQSLVRISNLLRVKDGHFLWPAYTSLTNTIHSFQTVYWFPITYFPFLNTLCNMFTYWTITINHCWQRARMVEMLELGDCEGSRRADGSV